jgi:hypothetical protein
MGRQMCEYLQISNIQPTRTAVTSPARIMRCLPKPLAMPAGWARRYLAEFNNRTMSRRQGHGLVTSSNSRVCRFRGMSLTTYRRFWQGAEDQQ